MERNALAATARQLEERDARSKWNWVTLGCAMLVAAGLAGGGAVFAAKANIKENDFNRSVQLITQDGDASWCGLANGQIVNASDGSKHCAIHLPDFQEPGEEGGGERLLRQPERTT